MVVCSRGFGEREFHQAALKAISNTCGQGLHYLRKKLSRHLQSTGRRTANGNRRRTKNKKKNNMGNGKSHSTAAGNFIDQMLSKTRKIKGGKLARRKVQALRSEQGSRSGNSPWLYVECLADIAEPIADIIRSEPSLLGFGPLSFLGKDHAVPALPLAAKLEYVLLQLERRVHRQSSASSNFSGEWCININRLSPPSDLLEFIVRQISSCDKPTLLSELEVSFSNEEGVGEAKAGVFSSHLAAALSLCRHSLWNSLV